MNKPKPTKREQTGLGDALFGTRLGEVRDGPPQPSSDPPPSPKTGADLFIVDNSDTDWKVRRYLQEWAQISTRFDIATGFFEIGSLLALDGDWQKLDKLRILMGNEVSARTRDALLSDIAGALDQSIETAKETNDFLTGVPAVVAALDPRKKQIECKVYTKKKFHAKAYITHSKLAVVGSAALVGSSNFTLPGLTTNVELNIQVRREVELLQQWFDKHWEEGEDVTDDLLKVIARHVREYLPFEVYAKSLQEYFRGHELTVGEWERSKSKLYPVLDQYQREGYQALVKIAGKWGGAFLCDGVGLGKTLIGLMVIERLVEHDRRRVALLVPKAGRKPVWEAHLKRYLPHLMGDFSNLVIINHTDLLRAGEYPAKLARIKEMADVVVIDEGHHFRNPGLSGKSRYWKLADICAGKTVYSLTATPINNSLLDLQHMIELFAGRDTKRFAEAPLGIHSLAGHFRKLENDLDKLIAAKTVKGEAAVETNQVEAEQVLLSDTLFRALVVQRSRGYVRKSQEQHGGKKVVFSKREDPRVARYSIKQTYGELLVKLEKAFSRAKPLFSLAMYYPLAYYKGKDTSIDPLEEGRQKQVVGLIRILFVKRFESSARAFEASCQTLLLRLLAFVTRHCQTEAEKKYLDRWQGQHADLLEHVKRQQQEISHELKGEDGSEDDEENEDIITAEMQGDVKELSRDEYKVEEIVQESYLDMDQLLDFIAELKKFKPANDDKLKALIKLLNSEPTLKTQKVLIFSEFMTTARYLKAELIKAGIDGVDEVDSADKRDRGDVIRQFAPYYNGCSSAELTKKGLKETRVLISTDVLSEGLNLQDATRLINYDLHWNPVRLMQRIGRVDRRINNETEAEILADHPEQQAVRGTAAYWNFLPPDELNTLIKLYERVSGKVLRISAVFGIEGKKLLTEKDDYQALKEFNEAYEGTTTALETMHLEYQKMLIDNPGLEERLNHLPGRVFSGKAHPRPDTRAVFFCYSLPAPALAEKGGQPQWTEAAGLTRWYLYNVPDSAIIEEPADIIDFIRSQMETPRHCVLEKTTLSEIRGTVEKHIKNTYFKRVQAPVGVKPRLKAWMELS